MTSSAPNLDFVPADHADLREATIHMAACISLAEWKFVKMLSALRRTRAWRHGGFTSLVHWLDYHCGLGTLAARERIRVGRALEKLPHIDAAFANGEIVYSKVRAITRVASPATDRMLLALAKTSTANALERLVRTYERSAPSENKPDPFLTRSVEWRFEEGMLVLNATLPAEQGALVVNALQCVLDGKQAEFDDYWRRRYEADHATAREDDSPETVSEEVSAETSDDRPAPAEASPTPADDSRILEDWSKFQLTGPRQRHADALVDLAEHLLDSPPDAGRNTPRRDRYEVVLHVSRAELANRKAENTRFALSPGCDIDEVAARCIGCDTTVSQIVQDRESGRLEMQFNRDSVPSELRQALWNRDRHCQFPGCGRQDDLRAHFIKHWFDGGEESLDNLVCLCHLHHRMEHLGGFHVDRVDGELIFTTPDGEVMPRVRSFPDVSDETLPCKRKPLCPSPRSVLSTHSGKQVTRMLHRRRRWSRGSGDRFLNWLQRAALLKDAPGPIAAARM